jgi:hypothetical protein
VLDRLPTSAAGLVPCAAVAGAEPVQAVRASSHPRPAAEAAEARRMQPRMPPGNVEGPLRCWRSAYVSTRSSQGSRAMSSHRLADAKARMKIVKPDILSGGHIGPPGLSEDEGEFVWYPPSAGATRACRGLSRPRKRRGSTAGEKIIRFRQ